MRPKGTALTKATFRTPFLRWPGGKRWLMPELEEILLGVMVRRYFEPFVGGGAFFYYFDLPKACLADVNNELINTYTQVRDRSAAILRGLRRRRVSARAYARARASAPRTRIARAMRFLYLNRTSFSGIYRVNQAGKFNVPYGGGERTPEYLWRNQILGRGAERLRRTELVCSDFGKIIGRARDGDLVYCDPIYTVSHNNNGFRRYNEEYFSWDDQRRLALACHRAADRGVTVIVSNADHWEVEKLYLGFETYELERHSNLSSDNASRRRTKELVFVVR